MKKDVLYMKYKEEDVIRMEEKARRSGTDRRSKQQQNDSDKRNNRDQRELIKDPDKIINLMKKIPIFYGLEDEDYKKFIRICSKKIIHQDEVICKRGDEPNELFILLKGQLRVMLSPSVFLTHITPIGLVGEIGIFTGAQRTATVYASLESTVISIHKKELIELFNNDCFLYNRILINVISDLANKLQEENDLIEELRTKKRTRML